MSEYLDAAAAQPASYFAAVVCLTCLLLEAVSRASQLRWIFAGLIYFTVAIFYLVDPIYRSESYSAISFDEFSDAYLQVILFLVSFRLLLPMWAPPTPTSALRSFDPALLSHGRFVGLVVTLWLILLTIGVSRMDFDIIAALFPLQTRSNWRQLWARPRMGGSFDFLISALGYAYEFVCSLFGLIAVSTRKPRVRKAMILLILISWPYFILCGARHKIIAVFMPSILAILLLKKWNRRQQFIFIGVVALAINALMLIIIEFRDDGLEKYFTSGAPADSERKIKHLGLNMTEELVFLNRYQLAGTLPPEWGYNYFANAVSIIPRPLWKDKPAPGQRYAELRVGFHRGAIAATMSNGLVGQGVANFGKWLGPLAPAILVALLGRWVSRLLTRGNRFLRACLVLTCLGTLPSLGRDITFILFMPLLFGMIGIKIYERQTSSPLPERNTFRPRPYAPRY